MADPSTTLSGATMPRLSGPTSVIINCDYQGVAKNGELPKTIKYTRYMGNVDLSASTTWSVTASNLTASIGTDGTITISEFTATGSMSVTSVQSGVTLTATVEVVARIENAPIQQPVVSGSQTTQASTSAFNLIAASAISLATATEVTTTVLTIHAPASPKWIIISAPFTYNVHSTSADKTGSASCYMKVQYRNATAAGAWTDCVSPTAWASLTDSQKRTRRIYNSFLNNEDKDGTIILNGTIAAGGLPATNQIEFRILAWREDNDSGMVGPFYIKSGSFTVQWSS